MEKRKRWGKVSIDRWGVNGSREGRGSFGLNETRCVMGPARGGNFVQDGGAECANPCVVLPAIWMHLEFGVFLSQRPGIFILGGQGEAEGG